MALKKTTTKRKKKPEKRKLIEKLDAVFSQYIRLKEATPHTGWVKCFTSGTIHHWTKIQAGHGMSRKYMSTRWDEMNVHPQSVEQNIFEHGNYPVYREKLVKLYGETEVRKLELRARVETKHWSEWELEEMIKYYSVLVAKIRQEKGL